jgi:hypothetical protein
MLEDLFHYIWKMKLFKTNNLRSTEGELIEIIHPGLHNLNAGPDFFNAKLKIGSTLWAGNVELHIKSSDWLLHQHQFDPAFQNIILHVVYQNDKPLFNSAGSPIKTLVLKDYIDEEVIKKYQHFKENNNQIACENSISKVPNELIHTYQERLIVNRLEQKATPIERLLAENNHNWEQSFYVQLAANFGFKVNQLPFELTARNTPLNIIAKHKGNLNQIEALLFGQAGFLNESFQESHLVLLQNEYSFLKKKYQLTSIDRHLWKFSRMRPVNFPSIRLAQFAALIHHSSHLFSKIIASESADELIKLFKVSPSTFWDTHYTFGHETARLKKNLGKSAIENLIINTIVPFIFVYGKHYAKEDKCDLALQLLTRLSPEKNSITQLWSAMGIVPKDALQSQSLIELKNNYCNAKKCLQCSIGHFVLKNN